MMSDKEKRMNLIEISNGKHICPTCVNCPMAGFVDQTTLDQNICEKFVEQEPMGTRYEDGNDRIYMSGIVTKDNGGGYWVVKCPYYIQDDEWCEMLDIEMEG